MRRPHTSDHLSMLLSAALIFLALSAARTMLETEPLWEWNPVDDAVTLAREIEDTVEFGSVRHGWHPEALAYRARMALVHGR